MEHPEKEMVLYDDEYKYDNVINGGEFVCAGVR